MENQKNPELPPWMAKSIAEGNTTPYMTALLVDLAASNTGHGTPSGSRNYIFGPTAEYG